MSLNILVKTISLIQLSESDFHHTCFHSHFLHNCWQLARQCTLQHSNSQLCSETVKSTLTSPTILLLIYYFWPQYDKNKGNVRSVQTWFIFWVSWDLFNQPPPPHPGRVVDSHYLHRYSYLSIFLYIQGGCLIAICTWIHLPIHFPVHHFPTLTHSGTGLNHPVTTTNASSLSVFVLASTFSWKQSDWC